MKVERKEFGDGSGDIYERVEVSIPLAEALAWGTTDLNAALVKTGRDAASDELAEMGYYPGSMNIAIVIHYTYANEFVVVLQPHAPRPINKKT
jgi:hypothetical protein